MPDVDLMLETDLKNAANRVVERLNHYKSGLLQIFMNRRCTGRPLPDGSPAHDKQECGSSIPEKCSYCVAKYYLFEE